MEKLKLSKKIFIRRLDYQFKMNFFSYDEFLKLSRRQSIKVIKYVARISNIRLTKREIKDTIKFIKDPAHNIDKVNVINSIWEFVSTIWTQENRYSEITVHQWLGSLLCYRYGKYELMRH